MMASKNGVGQRRKAWVTGVTRIALSGGFRRITAARDDLCGLTSGTGDAGWPAPRADGLITWHIIKHMRDLALHRWPPVGVRDMGGHQWTPSSKSTTLESHMSHFGLPHASLRVPWPQPLPTNGTGSAKQWRPCTPAMAAGLTDYVWSLREVLLFRVPPWLQPAGG